MSTTPTQICNKALGWIGANRITAFDIEEDSEEWELCNDNYASLRDAVLEEREWSFAVFRVIISPSGSQQFGIGTTFPKPADCLRVLGVWDSPGADPHKDPQLEGWEVEGSYIIADADTIYVRYIKRITDSSKFSPNFVEALSQRLAAELAPTLAESDKLTKRMWELYEHKMGKGTVLDGLQGRTRRMRSDALIRNR